MNRTMLIAVLLVALVGAVFLQTSRFGFVVYDDEGHVTKNPVVLQGFTSKGFIWAFTTGHTANWHPLSWLSHMLDVELHGVAPGGHHMTSVFFHAANSILLFLVLQAMTGAAWRSGFVAALFAVHPLHVESVAWIAERKDVLFTFFGLCATGLYLWYLKRPSPWRYAAMTAAFIGGLLAKPMLVTLPFALLLFDYWPLNRLNIAPPAHGGTKWREIVSETWPLIREKMPLFLLAAGSSVMTYLVQQRGEAVIALATLPLGDRLTLIPLGCLAYLKKALWPANLVIFYPHPGGSLGWALPFAAAIALVAITVGLWKGGLWATFASAGPSFLAPLCR